MAKKLILALLLLISISTVFATQSISNYKVTPNVYLNEWVTASGLFYDNNGTYSNTLCNFYFFDENGVLIDRASDQYTDSNGRFTLPPFTISEPNFQRNSKYTLSTTCGSQQTDANFTLQNRRTIANTGTNEFSFLTDTNNTDTVVIWAFFIIIILIIVYVIYLALTWRV